MARSCTAFAGEDSTSVSADTSTTPITSVAGSAAHGASSEWATMTSRRPVLPARRAVPMAALCVLVALLTSCVTVPTTGPVRKVEGQQQTCQNCVDVEVAAPSPGTTPAELSKATCEQHRTTNRTTRWPSSS